MVLTITRPYPFEYVGNKIFLEGKIDFQDHHFFNLDKLRIIIQTYPSRIHASKDKVTVREKQKTWYANLNLNWDFIKSSNSCHYHQIKILACENSSETYIDKIAQRNHTINYSELPIDCVEIANIFVVSKKKENINNNLPASNKTANLPTLEFKNWLIDIFNTEEISS
jgi:hypothetical protein